MVLGDGILQGRRSRYLDIYGVDECCQRGVRLTAGLCPDAKYESDDSCGGNSDEPCGNVHTAMVVPGTDAELLVLFVAQFLGGADDVLIIDFHIASSFV